MHRLELGENTVTHPHSELLVDESMHSIATPFEPHDLNGAHVFHELDARRRGPPFEPNVFRPRAECGACGRVIDTTRAERDPRTRGPMTLTELDREQIDPRLADLACHFG